MKTNFFSAIAIFFELEQNYFSLLTTRAELKSVVDVLDSILVNWNVIDSKKVKQYYFQNQYALRDDMKTILASRPFFNSKKMYFLSLIHI